MHKFKWRHYREKKVEETVDGETVQRVKRIFGDAHESKIHYIAGVDTLDQFADLEL